MDHIRYLGAATLIGVVFVSLAKMRRSKLPDNHPPIIHIPESEIYNNPREAAYENALLEHGPIIAVRRKGILEFIVREHLIQEIFTADQTFSFEHAQAKILNLRPYVSAFWSFFKEIDDLVQSGINPRLGEIFEKSICPVFVRTAETAVQNKKIDMFEHAHTSIAEAMVVLILGEDFVNERNIQVVADVATDIAALTGIYSNSSTLARHFPKLWSVFIWIKVTSTTVLSFFRIIGPQIWRLLRSRRWNKGEENPNTVLEYLAYRHASKADGKLAFPAFLWIMSLLLGIIFASNSNQSASVVVWVIFELALRPEYLQVLREEIPADPLTHQLDASNIGDAIQRAVWLDSFIREVMRTKGDTLSTCRLTTTDAKVAGYVIPKGHLVFPLATLVHMNPIHHPEPTVFRPERWHGENARPAVMSSASYIPFGIGRWACPGRVLAVSEIKMIVWSLIVKSTPRLEGNKYRVVDPLNITAVPPEGDLVLEPYGTLSL
ncbi:cytochrome P450 [Roridomyces roridus]|uniref:Cytochrome P450 n=1 Tax=Roridomyces roridus TaxID=1738132 RepID=A0AAD7B3F8_9AGAR|nr:cytochrome P450 [Roridomyces roridus]